jgi:hypothetical protein
MRPTETPSGEPTKVLENTAENPPDRWRDNPPVDKAWFEEAVLQMRRNHASGEDPLELSKDSTPMEAAAAAERKAYELWQVACNGRFELAQAKRRSTERLATWLKRTVGLVGVSAIMAEGITEAVDLSEAMNTVEANEARQAAWEKKDEAEAQAAAQQKAAIEARQVYGAEFKKIEIDLTGLDRAATPERMKRIIEETFPKDWMRNTASVTFKPQRRLMPKSYGMEGQAAAERSVTMRGDHITFYISSESDIWVTFNLILAHEVAHTMDWKHPWYPGHEQALKIKEATEKRLDAKNVHPSEYLADIKNADKSVERKNKLNEYPAIVAEDYIGSAEPQEHMVSEDIAIAEAITKMTDPSFDRDAAWEKRRQILDEMASEHFAERLSVFLTHLPSNEVVPRLPDMKERLERAWLTLKEAKAPGAEAAGRAALADYLRRWSGSAEERQTATDQLIQYQAFQRLATVIGDGSFMRDFEVPTDLLAQLFPNANNLDPKTNDKIRDEFAALTDLHKVRYGARLEDGEYARLMDLGKGWEDPTVLISTMGYRPAVADRPLAAITRVACPAVAAADRGRSGLL